MRRTAHVWRAAVLAAVFLCTATGPGRAADLHQTGAIGALAAGDYHGRETFAALARHGDFGLGTFAGLDGEMVAEGGRFYQVRSDGTVRRVSPGGKAPFAQVVFFGGTVDLGRVDGLTLKALTDALAARLPDPSRMYAVRVDGAFEALTARSVPAQREPWPPLAEAIKGQTVFPMENVRGVLVGFYTPPGLPDLSPPGWHFHFLSADRTRGGHVLAARLGPAKARGDAVDALTVVFPENPRPRQDAPPPAAGTE